MLEKGFMDWVDISVESQITFFEGGELPMGYDQVIQEFDIK